MLIQEFLACQPVLDDDVKSATVHGRLSLIWARSPPQPTNTRTHTAGSQEWLKLNASQTGVKMIPPAPAAL